MATRPYRSCNCREPGEPGRPGKLKGKSCDKLKSDSRHGQWYARFEAPPDAGGKRRQPRIGPFGSEREARRELTKVLGEVDAGMHAGDRQMTVAAFLAAWLRDKKPEIKERTWASYEEATRLYFSPGLGHLRLADLRDHHIRALYAAMRKINRTSLGEGPRAGGTSVGDTELLRRLLAGGTWTTCPASSGARGRLAKLPSSGGTRSWRPR